MDVRCERCKTEYEFDDARVTGTGVTVKCATCGHVFKVTRGLLVSPPTVADEAMPPLSLTPMPMRDDARTWRLRQAGGKITVLRELTTLQQWIVERKVSPTDEISLNGTMWKPLGGISALASFFSVVDKAQRAGEYEAMLAAQGKLKNSGVPTPTSHLPLPSASRTPPPLPGARLAPESLDPQLPPPPPLRMPSGMQPGALQPPSRMLESFAQEQPKGSGAKSVSILAGLLLVAAVCVFAALKGWDKTLDMLHLYPPVTSTSPSWTRPWTHDAGPAASHPALVSAPDSAKALAALSSDAGEGAGAATTQEPMGGETTVVENARPASDETVPVPPPVPPPPATAARSKTALSSRHGSAPPAVEDETALPEEKDVHTEGAAQAPAASSSLAQGPVPGPGAVPASAKTLARAASTHDFAYFMAQGDALREHERPRSAIAAYVKAADISPSRAEPVAGRGLALLDMGKRQEAVQSFQTALELNPSYGVALMGLAETYRVLGQREEAVTYYEKYLAVLPNGSEAPVARHAIEKMKE